MPARVPRESHGPPCHGLIASILQLLIAGSFLMMAVAAYTYGAAAQEAAEAAVAAQDLPPATLRRHGVKFEERGVELVLPVAIALVIAALAVLDLAGDEVSRTLSWILQPILLVGGGIVTGGQVFATRYLRATFAKSEDPMLRRVDVKKLIQAGVSAFPAGFRCLVMSPGKPSTSCRALCALVLANRGRDATAAGFAIVRPA
jgi:hypothetical protein